MAKQINLTRYKMTTPGEYPMAAWNAFIDDLITMNLLSFNGGRIRSIAGVGTDLEIDIAGFSALQLLGALQPGSDVSTSGAPKYTITYGTYGGALPTIDGVALVAETDLNIINFAPTDTYAYMQCDYTYNETTGIKTIVDSEIKSGSGALPVSTIAGGSGTLYEIIYGVTITAPVGDGPYIVKAAPAISTSHDFNICLAGPSVSGPFRA